MLISLTLLFTTLFSMFRSRAALQLENLALRHQIGVLQRSSRKRPKLTPADRLLWVWLSRIWRDWRPALAIVKPETVLAWHRAGFRRFWVRRGQPGRPVISREIRDLIRRMCRENSGWGAPRIHGELLKLGIDIGESSVSKYMVHGHKPRSQNWRTFLENHAKQLVSIDFFTVPTIRFQVLYVFLVLAHDRRRILHFNVTAHPTAVIDFPLVTCREPEELRGCITGTLEGRQRLVTLVTSSAEACRFFRPNEVAKTLMMNHSALIFL